jgi:hypothetical protein
MHRPPFTYVIAAIVSIAVAGGSRAQQPDTVSSVPGIEIETSVDLAEIYIGDLITYTISITYDSSYELEPPPLGANLGAFDVKDYEPDITETLPDGRIRSKTIFTLTTFTTGDYVIPPVPILFMLPDSSRKVLLAEPVPITVKSLLAESGDSLDIKPLKAQYVFERKLNPIYIWGGLALLLLLLAITVWVIRRRRRPLEEVIDLRPPWEIAFEKLAFLQHRNLPAEDNNREYYFQLTDIFREYLGRIYGLDFLEMTTEEVLERSEEVDLPDKVRDELSEFLRHADLVKFARFAPEGERAETDFNYVHDAIEQIRIDFERRQQEELALERGSGENREIERRPAT